MKYPIGLLALGCSLLLISCSSVDASSTLAKSSTSPTPQETNLGQMLPITAKANIAGSMINLEVTNTPEEQAMGLMYRTSLADDRGMLFSFNPPRRVAFWMKNCKISLDMIFLQDGVVRAIARNSPPCTAEPCPTYDSTTSVDRVIELRGGRAAELGVKVGDRITIQFLGSNSPTKPNP
ncbi:DUF192 domain-containing protein [Kamptonema animale CS-326]|jgi:uncharacterized membrane protein (UPF0127 family)|uniref:DUF192 domain-containing protein n=1 Tax=Kamptonema animale TaxID=92934 RepID=UPI00232AB478|nr:DUF192 domain-containing protein [Kamptonema animale]MDB9514065.1 DUF192 domain-containing protein [Kamptonema animale CS-326]